MVKNKNMLTRFGRQGNRVRVTHPFRVIKRQFGFNKVRYQGLEKDTAQLITLIALSNLWMARRLLMGVQAGVRLHSWKMPTNGLKRPVPKAEIPANPV